MATPNFLGAALYYAGTLGWKVFPCTPHEKTPAVIWDKEATLDPVKIKQWWGSRDYNIGVVCGAPSGIIALDVDAAHGGDGSLMVLVAEHGILPHTIKSFTGGGGQHILFSRGDTEVRNSASKLGDGLDIRGDGGYIVAAPSIHPNGKRYQWQDGCRPDQVGAAPLPEWILNRLGVVQGNRAVSLAAPVAERITSGQRNVALASLAGSMRRRGFDPDAIYAALITHNNAHCDPPLAEREVSIIARSIGRYQPVVKPALSSGEEVQIIEPRDMLDAYAGGMQLVELMGNLEGRDVKTGIARVDFVLAGLERQTLTVLAARPGMGKTTLAWQIARNVAARRQRVCFFSLEMSTASLYAKAVCGAEGVNWRDVRNGTAGEPELRRLSNRLQQMMAVYDTYLLVDDGPNSLATIEAAVEKYSPDLVVVDHLRLVSEPGQDENLRLGRVSKGLKDIGKSYNIAVLALAQLNRGVERQDNKRPHLLDLRESGHIEENADTVLMIYREDYYSDEPVMQAGAQLMGRTELLIRKFREGPPQGCIVLYFDPIHQWFEETGVVELNG